jgi:hypothetical protein
MHKSILICLPPRERGSEPQAFPHHEMVRGREEANMSADYSLLCELEAGRDIYQSNAVRRGGADFLMSLNVTSGPVATVGA